MAPIVPVQSSSRYSRHHLRRAVLEHSDFASLRCWPRDFAAQRGWYCPDSAAVAAHSVLRTLSWPRSARAYDLLMFPHCDLQR
jgi:hypothetical protein